MKEYGLFECNMLFSTYREYKSKKRLIKTKYNDLTDREAQIYKLYINTRPLLNDKQKGLIWSEVNDRDLPEFKINPKLDFNSYQEFKEKRKTIYLSYDFMNVRDRSIYRFYVYNKDIPEKTKDNIWNMIVGFYEDFL